MKNRPKNIPRWQWNKSQDIEKENLLQKKSLDTPQIETNIFGTIIVVIIMIGIIFIGYLSLSGGADWSGVQDPCDGSNRSICP